MMKYGKKEAFEFMRNISEDESLRAIIITDPTLSAKMGLVIAIHGFLLMKSITDDTDVLTTVLGNALYPYIVDKGISVDEMIRLINEIRAGCVGKFN